MNKTPHPIDSRPLIQDQIIIAFGKRYRVDRWQGYAPHYIFYCMEEDGPPPFQKTLNEVKILLENKTIQTV